MDINASVPGTIEETSGVLARAKTAGPSTDEIAGRNINAGGNVLAFRNIDITVADPRLPFCVTTSDHSTVTPK